MPITYQALPTPWNTARKSTVEGAMERIVRMLSAAHLSAQAVLRETEARNIYQRHFTNVTQLTAVQRIIKLMMERVTKSDQHLDFHYVPTLVAFNSIGVGPLPIGMDIKNVEAFVVQRGVVPSTRLKVYFAPAFFSGDVYVSSDVNARTGTGTFLHELSHGVGNTADHAYTWQGAYATLTPAQQAANADSYRAYCQGFDVLQTTTTVPVSGGAVLCPVCHVAFANKVKLMQHQIEVNHR